MAAKLLNLVAGTGLTVYAMILREADSTLFEDVDGSFAASPSDPYLGLTEHATINGLYQASEARLPWESGRYIVVFYSQLGGSEAPATDTILGGQTLQITGDAEITLASLNAGESLAAILALATSAKMLFVDLKQTVTQLRLLTTAVEKRTALKI